MGGWVGGWVWVGGGSVLLSWQAFPSSSSVPRDYLKAVGAFLNLRETSKFPTVEWKTLVTYL